MLDGVVDFLPDPSEVKNFALIQNAQDNDQSQQPPTEEEIEKIEKVFF